MVMIGDRLNTDILGANNYGMDSILVLSGETTREMLEKAPKEQHPTMVTENVGQLITQLNGTL
jgi:ribonucleotide monophosphatase NagD (HAD superfamily)